jgi:sialidase-1
MKYLLFPLYLLLTVTFFQSCKSAENARGRKKRIPVFEVQQLFADERFPNVVVATDGTVVATWGSKNLRARRSEDGGKTWGPEISIAHPGFQGGGTIVDENNGNILVFAEEGHPPAPLTLYRSKDSGKTWKAEKVTILPNSLGHIPSMHMNEHGITITKGKYEGRLIRPTRYYGGGNDRQFWDEHYTNAIYSDDGGHTWQASEPFPAYGTGEAAIAELADGTLYYNSRRHKSTDGHNPKVRYIAFSYDGGHTWENMSPEEELPDGAQHTDYGLMGGLTGIPGKRMILCYSATLMFLQKKKMRKYLLNYEHPGGLTGQFGQVSTEVKHGLSKKWQKKEVLPTPLFRPDVKVPFQKVGYICFMKVKEEVK